MKLSIVLRCACLCFCVYECVCKSDCSCVLCFVIWKNQDPSLLMITQTLKMFFNIQSTHNPLSVDKLSSNLICIQIAKRIPLANHTQIIMLTNSGLQIFPKPSCLFHLDQNV